MRIMNLSKRPIAIVLFIALMVTYCACIPTQQDATPTSELTIMPEATEEPAAEQDSMPYKGDGSEYTYIMTDERDRICEEDIVFFADMFLDPIHGHPMLMTVDCPIKIYNNYKYQETSLISLGDESLRAEFIQRINELILSIPEKDDAEILYGLAETAAILNDGHSDVWLMPDHIFAFDLLPIYTDNGVECYIKTADVRYEACLTARLDAINGIEIDEVLERMKSVISYENERYFLQKALRPTWGIGFTPLMNCTLLEYLDVVGENETMATFTFTMPSGGTFNMEIEAIDYFASEMVDVVSYSSGTGMETSEIGIEYMNSDIYTSCWHRLSDDGESLYIRFNDCYINYTTDALAEFINEAKEEAERIGKLDRVILDFRQNRYGFVEICQTFIPALNEINAPGGKYVLIDEGTYSDTAMITALLKRFANDVVLVGAPTGSPTNGMFDYYFDLPNAEIECCMGMNLYWDVWPDYEEETLMPDTIIYQTYEDYINGIDTVLKTLNEGSSLIDYCSALPIG